LTSVVLGASLLLVGIGGVVVSGTFDRRPTVRLVGQDAPVNTSARRAGDISAHNSPTLVRNPVRPANLAVSSRIDTPVFSCALHVSFDAGATWTQTRIPAPKGEGGTCYAPDVAFSADGTLYVSFVTLKGRGNVPHAVAVGIQGRRADAVRAGARARPADLPGPPCRRPCPPWAGVHDVASRRRGRHAEVHDARQPDRGQPLR